MKPRERPDNPRFSSGPCAKRPGWSLEKLEGALLGRSHRSKEARAKLRQALQETRDILSLPDDYRLAITPASDTGAMEMALWSLLGERGADVLDWDSFASDWAHDVTRELGIKDSRVFKTPYGEIPDLSRADFSRDLIFLWNGTTSGVRAPDGDWIPNEREGLVFCDATSALFAQEIPWRALDVITFSWQKVLGGEAAHGMIALSPGAARRLESFRPPRPMPKIFRMAKDGKIHEGFFEGEVINTPSLLCLEDYLDALRWAREAGGLSALIRRANGNLAAIAAWVEKTDWIDFLCPDPAYRSNTSVCLSIVAEDFLKRSEEERRAFVKRLAARLEEENAALDIGGYRKAPPGIRIWAGATVERASLEALFPWLEWAYRETAKEGV